MLHWIRIPAGYEAHGPSGRYYAILKHHGRFRLSAGGGHDDQAIGTLTKLKEICERIETQVMTSPGAPVDPPPEPAPPPAPIPDSQPATLPNADPDLAPDTVVEPEYRPGVPDLPPPGPFEDRDSLVNALRRWELYRDVAWRRGGVPRTVKRYRDVAA